MNNAEHNVSQSQVSFHKQFYHRSPLAWRGDHSTSINAYGVWGARIGIQISKRELYTHIHLDYVRIEILSFKNKKKKKKLSTLNAKTQSNGISLIASLASILNVSVGVVYFITYPLLFL